MKKSHGIPVALGLLLAACNSEMLAQNELNALSYPERYVQDMRDGCSYRIATINSQRWVAENMAYTPAVGSASWCSVSGNCGTFTDDRNNKVYSWVKVGTQTWMAENLAYLPSVSASGTGSSTVAYSYVYGYSGGDTAAAKVTGNYNTYGVLYNWAAAKAACPSGWHLPTDAEWMTLTGYVGGVSTAGAKLKANSSLWSSNTGTDIYGFSALPGGYRNSGGAFYIVGSYGYWWSATEYSSTFAYNRYMVSGNANVDRNNSYKENGFSVRCLKD